jgi:ribosomal protein S18 acetylase RimI-like enzyme
MKPIITLPIVFKIASTSAEFNHGQILFQEYAKSLRIDLCFQDFDSELKSIESQYNKPKGALIIAYSNNIAVGCVGIKEFDNDIAELKRMFVKTKYRGQKIGLKLLELAISFATELNYKIIRLDTLPTMIQAQNLYRSMGFYEIPPYRFNPIEGTVFMEKKLV